MFRSILRSMAVRRAARDPFTSALYAGIVIFLVAVLAASLWDACGAPAHASEGPPPTILPLPQRAQRQAPPPARDGPMCMAPEVTAAEAPTYFAVLTAEPATAEEDRRIVYALDACEGLRRGVSAVADPWALLALFRLERELGAPQGLLAAAFCVEVAMRSVGRYEGRHLGDWRDGKARAAGPLQLHENVWRGTCGGTADAPHDLLWAARCYWSEVLRVAEIGRRKAPDCAEPLRVAEAAAANVRRYGWRCDSRSAHWGMMEAMR